MQKLMIHNEHQPIFIDIVQYFQEKDITEDLTHVLNIVIHDRQQKNSYITC